MGSQAERTPGKVEAGGPRWARLQLVDQVRQWLAEWVVPHSHADKTRNIWRVRQTMQPRVPVQEKKTL